MVYAPLLNDKVVELALTEHGKNMRVFCLGGLANEESPVNHWVLGRSNQLDGLGPGDSIVQPVLSTGLGREFGPLFQHLGNICLAVGSRQVSWRLVLFRPGPGKKHGKHSLTYYTLV